MLDLIHTAGFFNKDWTSQMKDKDPFVVIKSAVRILEYREHLSLELDFKSFSELKHALGLSGMDTEFYDQDKLLKKLKLLEDQIKESELFIEDQGVVYRVRALRLQESPFRGCVGGSDCSSRIYFEKGLDPNYIYFTKTGLEDSKSSGQVTVVLGTVTVEDGSKKKVAFIDKVQNLPKEELIAFLSAVRESVQEEGYSLALPLKVGGHNGLSNTSELRNYVSENILPVLLRNSKGLIKFAPHPHDYNNFELGYSRAEQGLDLIEFTLPPGDNVQIISGNKYEDYSVEGLNQRVFIEELLRLRESKNKEDLTIYVDSILALNKLKDFKELLGEPEKILRKMLEETGFFKLKKKIIYILISKFEMGLSDFLYVFERIFTEAEKNSLRSEISNWKNSSDVGKKEFYELLRIAFHVRRPQLSYFKNLFKKAEELVSHDLKFILKKSRKENQEEYRGIVLDLLETKKWDDIKGSYDLFVAGIGYTKIVEALIRAGADVNAVNRDEKTALIFAASKGSVEAVKALIRAGADVNAVNKDEKTALMFATSKGYVEAVKALIEAGADVNAVDKYGNTALMFATIKGSIEAVKALIEAGADVNAVNKDGTTALMFATSRGYVEAVKALIEAGADVNAVNKYGNTALMSATRKGSVEAVKALIEAGADVNAVNKDGTTALMSATSEGSVEAVKALIEAGADVNAVNKDGTTALMSATSEGSVEAVKALIEAGADVNAVNKDGTTALMSATSEGSVEAVKALIEAEADVNAVDEYGTTALMFATIKGYVEAVKALIEAEADVNAVDKYGATALMAATSEGYVEAVKALIEAGADVNAVDEYGTTALMFATIKGSIEAVKALIEAGADVNAVDKYGNTVLMFVATSKGSVEAVKALIEAGADVNAVNRDEKTTLIFPPLLRVLF